MIGDLAPSRVICTDARLVTSSAPLPEPGSSSWQLLLVGGAGGGAYQGNDFGLCNASHPGGHAKTGTSGQDGGGFGSGDGGTDGDSGQGVWTASGGGGGHYYASDGAKGGGKGPPDGGAGGTAAGSDGGWGYGGGGAAILGGGGGGGYSGGGGGGVSSYGGGGGSYVESSWALSELKFVSGDGGNGFPG